MINNNKKKKQACMWCFYFEGVWFGVPPEVETEAEPPPEMASSGKNRDEVIKGV